MASVFASFPVIWQHNRFYMPAGYVYALAVSLAQVAMAGLVVAFSFGRYFEGFTIVMVCPWVMCTCISSISSSIVWVMCTWCGHGMSAWYY
jgi:hypothetical protein